jgi:non-heme Fe2+,alpha-ketoglutarate-dependent halogenase
MIMTEQRTVTFGERVKEAGRATARRLAVLPAALALLLKPFRFLYPLYPNILRSFLTSWSAEMIRLYVFSLGRRAYMDQPATVLDPPTFTPLIETSPEFQLSEEQIRSFYTNGFLGPLTLCSPEEMKEIREAIMAELERPSAVYGFRTGRDRHLDCESVYRLMRRPALTERLAQILGPNLLLWRSQVFVKPAGAAGVAWHQASTYLMEDVFHPALFPPDMDHLFQLGAWLAFDDVDVANGCLQFVPGSHRRIHTIRIGGKNERTFARANFRLECPIDPEKVVSMEMKAGQFVLFTEQTVHGSPPNVSDRRRWGMAFRAILPEVVAYGEARRHHVLYLNETYDLSKWGTIVLRGVDTAGVNRVVTPFPEPAPVSSASGAA